MATFGGEDKKRKLDGTSSPPSTLRPEDIKDLLTALKQEQVVDLLVKACSAHPDVLDDVRDAASKDPATRKLFVRGLPWETTTDQLRSAYEEFGEVVEGAVITDKQTGKSKGFGFVTFRHIDAAQKALRNPKKQIAGRTVYANLAALGSGSNARNEGGGNEMEKRKVYVGGLSYDTTNETLLEVFGQFGEIEEGSIALEKGTGKSRGFAFVTFKTPEGAQAACVEPVKLIDTRNVQVKLAAEGRQQRQQQEQTSASGLQSYSTMGGGNRGFNGGFMGNQPMMNQPMGGGMGNMGNMAGYANQGGMGAGQFAVNQGFPQGQQFAGQMGGIPQGAVQQPGGQQFVNQGGFAANPVAGQQFTPQQGGQQAQFGVTQQGFAGQQQFPAQMGAQVAGVQQPQGQFAAQAVNGQMGTGFAQGVAVPGATGMAGGVPNTMYTFQGQ